MKVVTVVGARPQFIKAAPVGVALRAAGITECLVHTGQHYDDRMSQVFFDEMGIAVPDRNLEIGSGTHGAQTGRMLEAIEQVLLEEQPAWLLVYGDTNSTLAGALAASKLGIPIAHVEAGLRSFNRTMPEEHNRVLTDHCSELLLCPTQTAVEHLQREGITRGVHLVGDVMYDAVLHFAKIAESQSTVLRTLELPSKGYYLATIHRPYNTDDPAQLRAILDALNLLPLPVVLPLHPRTRARLGSEIGDYTNIRMIDPAGYLDMLQLEQHAAAIMTDSGGVQKEAYFFGVPCFTLRPETEWVETVSSGWNMLVGSNVTLLPQALADWKAPANGQPKWFGTGNAATQIVALLAHGLPPATSARS